MSNFPTSLDTFTNPGANDPRNGATSASTIVSKLNDVCVALEAKIGINGSAVQTSFDYKLFAIATGDKAVALTATQTLTNKTLTAPKINVGGDATGDMYYRDSGGLFQRLAIGSAGQIISVSASLLPEYIPNPSASDASTTIKGVIVLATQAKVDTGDDTNTTSAKNVITPSTLRARLLNSGIVDTGSSTAYAIAPTPAITAYATYQEFTFKAVNANTTTTPTLAVSGLGSPKTIVNSDGSPLKVGQIPANSIIKVVYDGTNFQLPNNIPSKLGNWTSITANIDGNGHLSATDGFLIVIGAYSGSTRPAFDIKTDSSATPTTIRGQVDARNSNSDVATLTIPVKAGDYYLVNVTAGVCTGYFIPLN